MTLRGNVNLVYLPVLPITPSSRAIALSLQDHTESSSGPITLNEDEALFQQQLQHAIEISKANAQRGELAQPSASTNTFLSERAQLEKERRERQKRLRKAQGLPDSDDDLRAVSDEEDLGQPNAKRQRLSSSSVSYIGQTNVRTSAVPSSSKLGPIQGSFFWDGEWRPTATLGVEPRKDGRSTFRLSEVLGDVSATILDKLPQPTYLTEK